MRQRPQPQMPPPTGTPSVPAQGPGATQPSPIQQNMSGPQQHWGAPPSSGGQANAPTGAADATLASANTGNDPSRQPPPAQSNIASIGQPFPAGTFGAPGGASGAAPMQGTAQQSTQQIGPGTWGTAGPGQRQPGQQRAPAPAPVQPPTQPFSQSNMMRRPGQAAVKASMPPPAQASGPMQQPRKPSYTL